MTTRQHTYSIQFDDSRQWVDATHYVRSACTCGIASGMGHSTLESALHHEADHVCIGTRSTRPVWDGEVVYYTGLPVHITDIPLITDRAIMMAAAR